MCELSSISFYLRHTFFLRFALALPFVLVVQAWPPPVLVEWASVVEAAVVGLAWTVVLVF